MSNIVLIGKADAPDHFPPELIDHLVPVVFIYNQASYVFEHQTGQMWSSIPAFADYHSFKKIDFDKIRM